VIDRRMLILCAMSLPAAFGSPRALAQGVAQQPQPGRVTARSFKPVPSRITIEIAPLDNRPENLRIAAALRQQLGRAGHVVVTAGAPWRLSFESEVRPLSSGETSRPQLPEAETARRFDDDTRLPAEIPDRPLRRAPIPGASTGGPKLRYVLNATLDEAATGRRAWQGNVRYDDVESDRARTLLRLVDPLVSVFGRNQTGRSFALE